MSPYSISLPNLPSSNTPRDIVAPHFASMPNLRVMAVGGDQLESSRWQTALRSPQMRGVGFTCAAGLIGGLSEPIIARVIGDASPLASAALLDAGVATMVFATLLPESGRSISTLDVKGGLSFGACIALGSVVSPAVGMLAYEYTSAASVALASNIGPIMSATLAWAIFRQQPSRHMLGAAAASIGSGVLCAVDQLKGGSGTSLEGVALAVAASATLAIAEQFMFPISDCKGAQIVAVSSLAGGAVNAGLTAIFKERFPTGRQAGALFGCGAMLSLADLGYTLGMRELGPGRAAILGSVLTVTVGVLVSAAMGEGKLTTLVGVSFGLALLSAGILGHEAVRASTKSEVKNVSSNTEEC